MSRCNYFFLVILLLAAGCQQKRLYSLSGTVVATEVETGQATINAGDIPGYMSAMTMDYTVRDRQALRMLQAGDTIAATLVVSKDGADAWLENLRITGRGAVQTVPSPSSQALKPGDKAPDFELVNQDGKTIHLRDFAGKALLITFIYTRCPMPTFCPRLTSQFAKIDESLAATPDDFAHTHLLTISFDPKYDTPAVLRKYALPYLRDDVSRFLHWDFAAPSSAEMHKIADAFGLQYEEEEDQIAHTMDIVLIAPDGAVSRYWGTQWTASDLEVALRELARHK